MKPLTARHRTVLRAVCQHVLECSHPPARPWLAEETGVGLALLQRVLFDLVDLGCLQRCHCGPQHLSVTPEGWGASGYAREASPFLKWAAAVRQESARGKCSTPVAGAETEHPSEVRERTP